jgi:hypothetical protein
MRNSAILLARIRELADAAAAWADPEGVLVR